MIEGVEQPHLGGRAGGPFPRCPLQPKALFLLGQRPAPSVPGQLLAHLREGSSKGLLLMIPEQAGPWVDLLLVTRLSLQALQGQGP